MNFPDNLKYTNDHEWLKVEGNIGIVGVTDHAQGELGDVVYIDIPDRTDSFNAGDVIGTIEAVKTVADILSPISGKLIEINKDLNDKPEAVNQDPYGEGWMLKIEFSNPSEIDSLMDTETYKQLIGN